MTLEQEFEQLSTESRAAFIGMARLNLSRDLQHEAEDVVQEAFLEAWSRLSEFRRECTLKGFIMLVVLRGAWKRSKRTNRAISIDELPEEFFAYGGPSAEDMATAADVLRKVESGLSSKQCRFLEQWKRGEFAGDMTPSRRQALQRINIRARNIAVRKNLAA